MSDPSPEMLADGAKVGGPVALAIYALIRVLKKNAVEAELHAMRESINALVTKVEVLTELKKHDDAKGSDHEYRLRRLESRTGVQRTGEFQALQVTEE